MLGGPSMEKNAQKEQSTSLKRLLPRFIVSWVYGSCQWTVRAGSSRSMLFFSMNGHNEPLLPSDPCIWIQRFLM